MEKRYHITIEKKLFLKSKEELENYLNSSRIKDEKIRKIEVVSEEELERKSPLYFSFSPNFESNGKGRPSFKDVKIFVHLQKGVQSRLSNFM